MELTILGSGSAHARADRGQAGYVIREGDTQLVVDLGSGTLGRLCRAGLRAADTDAICLTHAHPDHVSDLVAFLFEMKHTSDRRRETLVIHAPPTFRFVFDALMQGFGQYCIGERYDVDVNEIETDSFTVGALALRAFPVQHPVPAIGLSVTGPDGRTLALTGDTGPFPELADEIRGADVLVADCTLGGDRDELGHLNAYQAGRLAAGAEVRTLVLSHLSPEADASDVTSAARSVFGGQVAKAADLMSLTI